MDAADLDQHACLFRTIEPADGEALTLTKITDGSLAHCLSIYMVCSKLVQSESRLVTNSGGDFSGEGIEAMAQRVRWTEQGHGAHLVSE